MWLSVRPYSQFAKQYDHLLGIEFFRGVRRSFEALALHYQIKFTSAADLGCGTGLFASYLARCWDVPVFGVDASREMLAAARHRCCAPRVCWLWQDIRCLTLPKRVDLITANFDTLNHLVRPSDLVRTFTRIHASLCPGGWFFFDFVTPCEPLGGRSQFKRLHCADESCVCQRVRWEPARQLLHIRIVQSRPGCRYPTVERLVERAYSPSEVATALSRAGFIIRGVHHPRSSRRAWRRLPRLVVVAQRPHSKPFTEKRCRSAC
jgi:SAM-dependent methyltransferase